MKLPILFQRLEGATLFLVVLYFLRELNPNWVVAILLWFSIDLTAVGYLINPKVGAIIYNLGHALFVPLLLLLSWQLTNNPTLLLLGLIWLTHIGIDRSMGYGLKLSTDFKDTHLGRIGK